MNEAAGNAVLDGGSLDGREHHVEPDTAELLVVMEDRARNLYVRAAESRPYRMDGRCLSMSIGAGLPTPFLWHLSRPSSGVLRHPRSNSASTNPGAVTQRTVVGSDRGVQSGTSSASAVW